MAIMTDDVAQLKDLIRSLQSQVSRLSDEAEITKLQNIYGYYLDKCLYEQVADLFAKHDDTQVTFLGGLYKKQSGVRRLYVERFGKRFVDGRNGPVHGFLLDHAQLQGVITVDPKTGDRALGRFRTLMSAGVHKTQVGTHPRGFAQWWEGGLYENEYIKENGVWKILKLRYFPFWHADFEKGWSNKDDSQFVFTDTEVYPQNPVGPDVLGEQIMLWPDTRVVPFHYPHPVTGQHVATDDLRAPKFGEDVASSLPPLPID